MPKSLEHSYVVVMVTAPSREEAEKIVGGLLDERLTACANIIGRVRSIYCWAGSIAAADEFLIFMKSRADLFEEVSEKVKALHSYEIPEIVAIPVLRVSKSYAKWLGSCLK
jgi:periplasmic divalent cation tolerance protein